MLKQVAIPSRGNSPRLSRKQIEYNFSGVIRRKLQPLEARMNRVVAKHLPTMVTSWTCNTYSNMGAESNSKAWSNSGRYIKERRTSASLLIWCLIQPIGLGSGPSVSNKTRVKTVAARMQLQWLRKESGARSWVSPLFLNERMGRSRAQRLSMWLIERLLSDSIQLLSSLLKVVYK